MTLFAPKGVIYGSQFTHGRLDAYRIKTNSEKRGKLTSYPTRRTREDPRHTPVGIAVSPDGRVLYVSGGELDRVRAYRLGKAKASPRTRTRSARRMSERLVPERRRGGRAVGRLSLSGRLTTRRSARHGVTRRPRIGRCNRPRSSRRLRGLMRRASLVLVVCAVLAAGPPAGAARGKRGNQLLRITTPSGSGRVAAHPFVNVVLRFGNEQGTIDPATFRASLGGVNVTPLFQQITENGTVTGMRASLGPALLNVGTHRANRLRLEVRGRVGKKNVRDVDRLRFRAIDVPDEAPVARALAASDVILANVPLQFDGSQSHDPEDDVLQYLWEFDDGTTSTDAHPVHVFPRTR
jgi:hypothetical protein